MKLFLREVLVSLVALLGAAVVPAADEVPRWEPHDFAFAGPADAANPFRVAFSAEIVGPDGRMFTLPGFFDGDGTWKIRVSPTHEGAWSIVTRSDTPALDGRRAAFTCVPNRSPVEHGALRIDPARPRQFVYEDGKTFLPIGYECDWLWALDAGDPKLPTIEPFLEKIAKHGFNLVLLNAYAHDTTWRKGRTSDEDFGPPPFYAWAGTNEQPDHARFNLGYWQHYDRVIEALARRGIWAHVFIKVYNKQVNWPANGSAEDDLYFRWLIARYAAFPNLTWDLAKEAHYEKDVAYKLDRLRFLRVNDPYHRLVTVHDDRAAYDRGIYDGAVDYRSDQQHKDWGATMLAHRAQRLWPVINTEFGYEHGPGGIADKTYNVVQSAEEVARRAWEIYFAGGSGAYYYTYTAWDILRVGETPPGYAYFKHLGEFFARTNFARLQPTEKVASRGDCLADPGREYAVFLKEPGTVVLQLAGAEGEWDAEWFRPFTGELVPAATLRTGPARFTPPMAWKDGPVALHVTRRPNVPAAARHDVNHGLRVSDNHRYLVDAQTGAPVFLLADTAWNLGALKLDEIETYLHSREEHGFAAVMFALNFAPQADEKNSEGEAAYVGEGKTQLNPAYFKFCDSIVTQAAAHNLYVVLYAMWAGEKAGTMNHYTADQLSELGHALGERYRGVPNVIFCAGGEASPHYIEPERVNVLGRALKEGSAGKNLVTVHPVSPHSTSQFYGSEAWLDFFMSQGKSGSAPANALFDAAALVLGDWRITDVKPTMMGEHRYESGTTEDPLIQRRSLYQCVFAGGCGYAYGNNALWQMTPHTAQPWMLKGWMPGVAQWSDALDTPAVRQLQHIKALLFSHPFLTRIPDQSLVLDGQGNDVTTRTQATRDGTLGKNDASYILAYVSAPRRITLDTAVIRALTLRWSWFNPETGEIELVESRHPNSGTLTIEPCAVGRDWVVVVESSGEAGLD